MELYCARAKMLSKTVQFVKRILLPHFHSEMLIFDVKSFKAVIITVMEKMSTNLYSMRFVVNISFLCEKVSSHNNQFVFRKMFQSSQKLMQKQVDLYKVYCSHIFQSKEQISARHSPHK